MTNQSLQPSPNCAPQPVPSNPLPTPSAATIDAYVQTKEFRILSGDALLRRLFAKNERARVDAYVLPIFARYEFYTGDLFDEADFTPERITKIQELYLCADEEKVAQFFEECSDAHAAHGFTGERGYNPALVAEHECAFAEGALIKDFDAHFGCHADTGLSDIRKQMIDNLLNLATIRHWKSAKTLLEWGKSR